MEPAISALILGNKPQKRYAAAQSVLLLVPTATASVAEAPAVGSTSIAAARDAYPTPWSAVG